MSLTRLGTNAITALPAGVGGKVLQVINITHSTWVVVSSTTYVDTGLTATITPSSTSSKILVIVNLNAIERRDGLTWLNTKVLRGSTQIVGNFSSRAGLQQRYGYADNQHHTGVGSSGCTYLDSPNSISQQTYKVQMAGNTNVNSVAICADNSPSEITLMEIAG